MSAKMTKTGSMKEKRRILIASYEIYHILLAIMSYTIAPSTCMS